MTTRKPLKIGPFSRGINLHDDPTAIRDDELVEALNFDPGFDGSMKSRPPFTDTGDNLPLGNTGNPRLLGYYYRSNGNAVLIASDGLNSTWRYENGSWALITSSFSATDMAQFDGKAWLVPPVSSTADGGYWTPDDGFTADEDMPHGTSIAAYKSRLWIAEGLGGQFPTRIRYSKVLGQPDFWDNAGFTDVGSGDGQSIVKIVTYFDNMLVFRSKSIWSFQYGIDPVSAIQGVIVPGVGLSNTYSLVAHESYLYFMYDEKAYEFINNRASQINLKVPFASLNPALSAIPFSVSNFNNRIIFSYYEMMYVYSLRTKTWTTWRSDSWGPIGQIMSPMSNGLTDEAYALPSGFIAPGTGRSAKLLSLVDRFGLGSEMMQCSIQTKNYAFDVPGSFKVLFWWGVDSIFQDNIRGQAVPVVYKFSTTWGELLSAGVTWGDGLGASWAFPHLQNPEITSDVESFSGPIRKFVKFFKKLRFRQIFFRISFQVDGTISTSPVQIFTLQAYMAEKQTVSDTIS